MSARWSARTRAVAEGRPEGDGAPLNQPLVLASNFRAGGDYTRTHGTETWRALEQAIGSLEGGSAISFASGMGAASALLFALAPRCVVIPSSSYLGVRALLAGLHERSGLELRSVDVTDTAAVLAAADGADVVWLESPTNPTLDEADLSSLCTTLRDRGVATVVDSTFATPIGANPLEMGATAVMHSGTKLIGGHSDLLIGLAVTRDEALMDALVHARVVQGATPGSLEAFLALRGLRTLAVRYHAAVATAVELADRLSGHPNVGWLRQRHAMISFQLPDAEAADRACERVELIVPATSLGGVETTMERRAKYAGDAHVAPGLIRMSVGLEDVDDLWDDLSAALD